MKPNVCIITLMLIFVSCRSTMANDFRVLILLPNKYGANYYLDRANFENYGWRITVAGTNQNIYPCPAYASQLGCPVVHPDTLTSQIGSVTAWDAVAVMSGSHYAGNPCGNFLSNQHVLELVHNAADTGLVVAGFCTGVRVLAAADVINGLLVTGNPEYQQEYVAAGAIWAGKNKPPQIQGNIITCSAGDFFNIQNCAAILQASATFSDHPGRNNIRRLMADNTKSGVLWIHGGGSSDPDGATTVESIPTGGSVIAGYTYSGTNRADLLLMKLNDSGEVVSTQQLEEPGWQFATDMVPDGAGGYMLTGYGEGPWGSFDVILVNVDSNLDTVWRKHFGGTGFDVATSICRFSDGSYVISGYTESFGAGQDDFYLIRVDNMGDTLWTKTIGTANSEMGFKVIETTDHHIVMTGNSGTFPASGPGNRNVRLIKLTMDGDIMWQRSYDTPGPEKSQEWGAGLIQTSDGGYLIAGHHDITGDELKNGLLLKCDGSGNELWRKSIGEGTFYDGLESVVESDGRFHACGMTSSPGQGNEGYFVTIQPDGTVTETEIFGAVHPQFLHEIKKSDNGDLIMAGQTWSADSAYNTFVVKYHDGATSSVSHPKKLSLPCSFSLKPNPFSETLTIGGDFPGQSAGIISLFDSGGKIIGTSWVHFAKNTDYSHRTNELFPALVCPGVYILEISVNGCLAREKVIYSR